VIGDDHRAINMEGLRFHRVRASQDAGRHYDLRLLAHALLAASAPIAAAIA
jgi:hypothetical protein